MDWQPIETCPQEGTYIIYSAKYGEMAICDASVGYDKKPFYMPVCGGRDGDELYGASHWMPLPPPPASDPTP